MEAYRTAHAQSEWRKLDQEEFPDCVEKCKFLKVGEDVAGKDKRALS